MIHKFYNGKIILGSCLAPEGTAVYTDGDKIIAVTKEDRPFDVGHDAGGKYISPGFIDIHVHGGFGYRFEECKVEEFFDLAEKHAQFGTTTLLPTASAATTEQYVEMFETFRKVKNHKNPRGAYMPGFHMEAPYFSPLQAGAQGPLIRGYDKEEYTMLIERYGDLINRWSAAPELPGARDFAKACREAGIQLSIGHSEAEYDEVMEMYGLGFDCVTHLYSCTSTVHRKNAYRYAGIVEAAYMLDGMDVEIIADGKHLPAPLLKFVVKHKGLDRVSVVTDATRFAGFPDGAEKTLGFTDVIIEDGVAKVPDRSCFSGSCATTDRLVRNMVQLAELPVLDAVRLATVNPARMAHLDNRGAIREGNFADIIIFDDNINVSFTMVNGNVVFEG
ncbi:MAG: amidohydrolase family protein [Oscillospiraceae bacterium]|nr:amidohydrolase family protein [Oscillospiraceae bacterium]